jgi:putative ABC transport system permease protein
MWAKDDTTHTVSPTVEPLRATFAKNYRTVGQALGAAVALVLLIACANVGGTMLARSIFRRREIGVRVALGASAGRVRRQLLTESLALAALAGALGTLGGEWALRAIVAASPTLVPPWVSLGVSGRTIAYSFGLVTLAAGLFGIVPTLQLSRLEVSSQLLAGGGRTTGSVPQRRLLGSLVTLEVVFAVVLLVGGGLLVRAYANLRDVDPGFRVDGVAEFRLALPSVRYRGGLEELRFFESVVARLDAIPGVDHAGFVTCPPFGCHWGNFFEAEGAPARRPGQQDPVTLTRYASPDYFATMGIRLARGRFYAPNEGGAAPGAFRPAVVNQEFAHQFWPGLADPTGKRFHSRGDTSSNWSTVVGVVKDVKHYGLSTPMRPGLYFPITRIDSASDFASYAVVVHTTRNPSALFSEIRSAIHQLDPELPVYLAKTMQAALDESLAQQRTTAFALTAFAAIALVLAVGGIYAMLSYVVGRRRHEIGIRMALGAQRRQVSSLVVRQGLTLVAIGLALGLPLAVAGSRVLGSLLFGLSAYDLPTYAGAAALLALTGALAAYVPARRAARVDPKIALSEGT